MIGVGIDGNNLHHARALLIWRINVGHRHQCRLPSLCRKEFSIRRQNASNIGRNNPVGAEQVSVVGEILAKISVFGWTAALYGILGPSTDNHRLANRSNHDGCFVGDVKRIINRQRKQLLAHRRKTCRVSIGIDQRREVIVDDIQRRGRTLAGISPYIVIKVHRPLSRHTAPRRQ